MRFGQEGEKRNCFLYFYSQKMILTCKQSAQAELKAITKQSKLSLISVSSQLNPPAALPRGTILGLYPVRSNVSLGFRGSGDIALDDRQLAGNSAEDRWKLRISEGHSKTVREPTYVIRGRNQNPPEEKIFVFLF